jgi:hypothetical protein
MPQSVLLKAFRVPVAPSLGMSKNILLKPRLLITLSMYAHTPQYVDIR